MSRVVAARFETFAAADSAAHALFAAKHEEDAVNIFYVNAGRRPAMIVRDPDPWMVRYGAQACVAGLAMAGAVLAVGIVLSFSGPKLLMLAAVAMGAFLGSWVGAVWMSAGGLRTDAQDVRHAGVFLTVQVSAQDEACVRELLCDAGGLFIERARGRWRHEQWTETDHVTQ